MTCQELYGRLTDLTEGSLQPDICAEVERHLASCAGCQQVRQDPQDLARLCRPPCRRTCAAGSPASSALPAPTPPVVPSSRGYRPSSLGNAASRSA